MQQDLTLENDEVSEVREVNEVIEEQMGIWEYENMRI